MDQSVEPWLNVGTIRDAPDDKKQCESAVREMGAPPKQKA
jgi:hypothetical protein